MATRADALAFVPPYSSLPLSRTRGGVPRGDRVRPVEQAVLEQAGEAFGELEAAALAVIVTQVSRELRFVDPGQRSEHMPTQPVAAPVAAERFLIAQHRLRGTLQPFPWQQH